MSPTRKIEFFWDRTRDRFAQFFHHEWGHEVALIGFEQFSPGEIALYRRAVIEDYTRSGVGASSRYGQVDLAEDFAEAYELWVNTQRGIDDPQVRIRYQSRFRLLDQLMGESVPVP
jgi:hypothetical protein